MFQMILIIIICIILIHFIITNKKPKGYPPGPISFPIFGHFPYFAKCTDEGIHPLSTEWSNKYGPIVAIDLGLHRAVIIKDPKLIKEAFNIPQLCGRMRVPVSLIRSGKDGKQRGIIFNDGQNWIEQKRFVLRHLRDFGFGKTSIENIIIEETQELIKYLNQTSGQSISTQSLFNAVIINTIWTIVAGDRFQHDDPKLNQLVASVTQNLSETGSAGVIVFLHWIAKLFPNATGWNKYLKSFYVINSFIREFVESRKKTHNENNIQDFTACYIQKINTTTDKTSSFYKDEGVNNLVTVLDDLFCAGGETTSTTMSWLMLCVAMHPNIQEKVYAEIDSTIGRDRLPSMTDKSSMPYMEAIILETLRISSVVYNGIFHNCTEDYKFHDYFFPKDTIIISNLYGIHHDPKIWGDPEKFRPERFLTSDEKTIIKHEAFMPFSSGKRICPGDTFAKDQLFLTGVTIFQKFIINIDPICLNISLKQKVNGLVALPVPHKLIFIKRQDEPCSFDYNKNNNVVKS